MTIDQPNFCSVSTIIFSHRVLFFHKLAAEKPRCGNRVLTYAGAIETSKKVHFCDPHIRLISMLPGMQRFVVKHGIEDQSKLVFLGKFRFSLFHLHVYGLKQRGIKVLSYRVK